MSRPPVILLPPEPPADGAGAGPGAADARAFGDRETRWRFSDGSAAGWTTIDSDGIAAEAAVAAALHARGLGRRPVVLALPSAWCLSGTVSTDGLPRQNHQALLYRLEERLPVAAESLVADFVPAPSGATAFGVCTSVDRVRPLVDALESAGISVGSITPLALLIAAGMPPHPAGVDRLLVVQSSPGGGIDLVLQSGRTPVRWALAADVADAVRRARWMAPSADLPVVTLGLPAAAIAPHLPSAMVSEGQDSVAATAVAGAAAMQSSTTGVDLRRDALAPADRLRRYRGGLVAVGAAALVLLSATTVAGFVLAARYQSAAHAAEAAAVAEMKSAYPAQLAAASDEEIRALLAAERRSWANAASTPGGAPAAGSSDRATPRGSASPGRGGAAALRTLHDVIRLLPDDAGISVDSTMFDESSFELAGRARSYEDLDKLTSAIRAGRMEVSSPVARRGPDGTWTFTLRGSAAVTTALR